MCICVFVYISIYINIYTMCIYIYIKYIYFHAHIFAYMYFNLNHICTNMHRSQAPVKVGNPSGASARYMFTYIYKDMYTHVCNICRYLYICICRYTYTYLAYIYVLIKSMYIPINTDLKHRSRWAILPEPLYGICTYTYIYMYIDTYIY
jgi:hypothetical protein